MIMITLCCVAGERPYHCGACGQRYTQGHLLKAHIRSRHGAEMAFYNMDKRSDSVRCRRALNASRLDHTGAPPTTGIKEDKIRFLLEAAEAARGGGGSAAPRPAAAGFGGVPAPGMSLGQYVSALSSCLPGAAGAGGGGGMRPLLWNPISQAAAAAFQQALPHDGLTSHAALLSSLAAAPVQNTASTIPPPQSVPDRSILNSLLASYATGAPLFSINGLSTTGGTVTAASSAETPGPYQLPRQPLPSDGPTAGPQDLSMSAAARDASSSSESASRRGVETGADTSFLSAAAYAGGSKLAAGSPAAIRADGYPVSGTPDGLRAEATRLRASDVVGQWAAGVKREAADEAEQATDLSVRGGGGGAAAGEMRRHHQSVPDDAFTGGGTVDLSTRISDRKPRHVLPPADLTAGDVVDRSGHSRPAASDLPRADMVDRLQAPPPGHSRPATDLSRGPAQDSTEEDTVVSCRPGCGEAAGSSCPHLAKLRELRRNVYRMLSVFTPYLDVSGAGIGDFDDDAVDDFLHEVIYSSKLDQ